MQTSGVVLRLSADGRTSTTAAIMNPCDRQPAVVAAAPAAVMLAAAVASSSHCLFPAPTQLLLQSPHCCCSCCAVNNTHPRSVSASRAGCTRSPAYGTPNQSKCRPPDGMRGRTTDGRSDGWSVTHRRACMTPSTAKCRLPP